MAGNQEHIRHSKFRSFYSAWTIFLDFSLFRRGQRAGDLLKGFVLRDATLSGYTGGGGVADRVGPAWVRGAHPTAPNGLGLGWWVSISKKPWYLRGRARGSPHPPTPAAICDQSGCKGRHEGPSSSSRDRQAVPLLWGRSPCQRGVRHRACRINTHPLYTSRCLSGIAAQSLFLNSLLYYTGRQIAAACLLPCQGCCSPARPGEHAVLHTAWGDTLSRDGDGAKSGR